MLFGVTNRDDTHRPFSHNVIDDFVIEVLRQRHAKLSMAFLKDPRVILQLREYRPDIVEKSVAKTDSKSVQECSMFVNVYIGALDDLKRVLAHCLVRESKLDQN